MTFILTNDDGVDAPGIKALLQAVKNLQIENQDLSYPIITVAPQEHLSGCGHQVTTTKPIYIDKRSESEYAIAGTPADCVRVAMTCICPEIKCVLSGINAGGNMGVDSYISGTVAAVREAAIHGIPAIAFSHYKKKGLEFDWESSTRWTTQVIKHLITRPHELGTFWNVNLPHLTPEVSNPELPKIPEIIFCNPCTKPLPVDYRIEENALYYQGEYAKRQKTLASDVDVCFSDRIAVTQLRV
ncbi:MAG: 5'/3'-nucleotidase SurE [Cyanobacteria bacterium P01_A01_bin.45]